MMTRSRSYLVAALVLAACSDGGPTDPDVDESPTIRALSIIGGDAQQGPVHALLPEPLTVAVTSDEAGAVSVSLVYPGSRMSGDPVPGTQVNFVVTDPACGRAFAGAALTDSLGRAADLWELGTRAGACRMEVRAVSAEGVPMVFDTFFATALPGAVSSFTLTTTDTVLFIGDAFDVAPFVTGAVDQYGNAVSNPAVSVVAPAAYTTAGSVITPTAEAYGNVNVAAGVAQRGMQVLALRDLRADTWEIEYECTGPHTMYFDEFGPTVHPDSMHAVGVIEAVTYNTFGEANVQTRVDRTYWLSNDSVLTYVDVPNDIYITQRPDTIHWNGSSASVVVSESPRVYALASGAGVCTGWAGGGDIVLREVE